MKVSAHINIQTTLKEKGFGFLDKGSPNCTLLCKMNIGICKVAIEICMYC